MPQENIVQVQFFLGKKPHSLSGLFAHVKERMADEAPLMLHLRFYDKGGAVTSAVLECQHSHRTTERLREKMFKADGLRRRWLSWRHKRLRKRHKALYELAIITAVSVLKRAAADKQPIAIDDNDDNHKGPLRYVRPDEIHEFIEWTSRSYHGWMWVFAPNDLLANKNKLLCELPAR